jgi:hypothetical protein
MNAREKMKSNDRWGPLHSGSKGKMDILPARSHMSILPNDKKLTVMDGMA